MNEETINTLNSLKQYYNDKNEDSYVGFDDEDNEAIDMAIKALEQQPILEKIRAKIENHCGLAKESHCRYCPYCTSLMGVREILEIIDKYKAESEDKE